MKKLGFIIVLMFFILAFPGAGQAASTGTHIYLDGVELQQPAEAQAGNVNGSVMVPLRVIIESLGYEVQWDKVSSTVTIRQGDQNLQLAAGKHEAVVNGTTVDLAVPPALVNNSMMVPLRFVGEQTGLEVSWDNATKSAYLNSPVTYIPEVPEVPEAPVIPETPEIPSGQAPNGDTSSLSSIQGISFSENRLMIAVSSPVQPNVFTMNGPDRLVIDIPGAAFSDDDSNSLQLNDSLQGSFAVTDYPDVKQVRYSMFSNSPSTVRVVVDLNHPVQYHVSNAGEGLIIVDITDAVQPGFSGRPLVVIDAGHGGEQPGAISITDRLEKDFTLAVILKVEQLLKLETEFDYVLTRSEDVTMSLQDRVKIANDRNATIFVSLHGNSFKGKTNPSGTETYYTRDESIPLANIMHKHQVAATGLTDRNVRYSDLHVTRETKMPAVLLEAGYLSHTKDEALMYSEEFQMRLAQGIVAGIKEYLGL